MLEIISITFNEQENKEKLPQKVATDNLSTK